MHLLHLSKPGLGVQILVGVISSIDRCFVKIGCLVFILFTVELCATDQILYTDEYIIQGHALAASLIMLVIAVLTEVFIGWITQSVYTAMFRHFTITADVHLYDNNKQCY